MAGKIITILNQKGGVAKTTMASLISNGLAHKGYKVLAIDLDQQASLTYILNVDEPQTSMYDVLKGTASAKDILVQTDNIDLLPANGNLAGVDLEIQDIGKEYRLQNALKDIQGDYDYIIIDTPPTLSLVTINALTASAYVVIPSQADILSLQGLGQLYNTIRAVKQYTNPTIQIAGIVVTRHNPRTILTNTITEMLEDTADELNTIVFNAKIREAIAIKEAQAQQTDFFTYDKGSNVYKDITKLIDEILQIINK